MTPTMIHGARISAGVCTCRATTYGLMKMPAPMIPPITIIVASNKPSRRARLTDSACRLVGSAIPGRLSEDHYVSGGITDHDLVHPVKRASSGNDVSNTLQRALDLVDVAHLDEQPHRWHRAARRFRERRDVFLHAAAGL